MSVSDAYLLGRNKTLEKLALSDTAITAGTAFVSPLASGLTADDGKGLQTSLSGMAGNLLAKKIFKSNLAGRLAGSASATLGSKVGAGLVSPDPEELKDMRRRGEFSKWEYGTRGLRTMGTSAAIGGLLASGAGIPAALAGIGVGAGRGAFSGYVVSPMLKEVIQGATSKFRERQELRDQGKRIPKMKPPFIENTVKTLEQPHIKSKMDYIHKELI